jgi:hypothetical protein
MYELKELLDALAPKEETPINHPSAKREKFSISESIAAARRGENWYVHARGLTASLINRDLSDEAIHSLLDLLLIQPGYTAQQTFSEIQKLADDARKSFNRPNPTGDIPPEIPILLEFIGTIDAINLPKRDWVVGRDLIAGQLSMLVAPPGAGKSVYTILLAAAIATGRNLTGAPVHKTGRVWIYNNEDDLDELKRRLVATASHYNIPMGHLASQIAINSGTIRRLIVAKTNAHGHVQRMPDVEGCIEQIKKHGVSVFIVDPMIETHECDENANNQMRVIAGVYREIAQRTGCAVLLVHHTAKPSQASSEGYAGNMYAMRGASSLIGVARVVQTIFSMSERDRAKLHIPEEERHLYLRLDDAKANLSLTSPFARWFKKFNVKLANNDEVGVIELQQFDMKKLQAERERILQEIVGALVAVPDIDGKTVSAAAEWLAWNSSKYSEHRETGKKNRKGAKRPFRQDVKDACDKAVEIPLDGKLIRFNLEEKGSKKIIRRVDVPF